MTSKSQAKNATEAQEMDLVLQNAATNAPGTEIVSSRRNARQIHGKARAMAAEHAGQSKDGATATDNGQANTNA